MSKNRFKTCLGHMFKGEVILRTPFTPTLILGLANPNLSPTLTLCVP